MNTTDTKISPFGIKFGIIASLVIIIYGMILNLTGLHMNQSLGYVNYLLLGGIMFLASNNYKEANEGFISVGNSFKISILIAAIAGFISSIFSYLYMTFVDQEILQIVKEMQYNELEKQGLTDSQIETAMEMSEVFMTPSMVSIFAFIGMLILGAIVGLIVALLVKKPRPIFE